MVRKIQWLSILIALVQLFDIVIHVGTNQIEPIRIVSNMFIFVWLGIIISGRLNHIAWRIAGGFVGAYVLMNALFLVEEGLINPTNGQFRTMLFVLVGVTVSLSIWLTRKNESQFSDKQSLT